MPKNEKGKPPEVMRLNKKNASTETSHSSKPETEKGFDFGLGSMKELAASYAKAQEVQEGAKKLQEELEEVQLEVENEDGSIVYLLNGNQRPINVAIKTVEGRSAEEVSQAVLDVMKRGHEMSAENMKRRLEDLTSGLNFPTLQ